MNLFAADMEERRLKKRRKRWIWALFKSGLLVLAGSLAFCARLSAGNIYDSPYITFSPDHKAFTTNAGVQEVEQYSLGTVQETGAKSSLRALQAGEHYYRYTRVKDVPVGFWRVEQSVSLCIHDQYPPLGVSFHQIPFRRDRCFRYYFSGWWGYCADCGDRLMPMFFYMSRQAAASLSMLDLDLAYYYLCPFCQNLEQGVELSAHLCRGISSNQYQIRYDANISGASGFMENSLHMYNNDTTYEGNRIEPEVRLRKNNYAKEGYLFQGWNTRPDGTGQSFADEQEIWNLTQDNYDGNGSGTVVLYAQWSPIMSTLRIDPAGGSYQGNAGITEMEREYGAMYRIASEELQLPEGNTVTFLSQGGSYAEPLKSAVSFRGWTQSDPFHGRLQGDLYCFSGEMGSVDTLTAVYDREAVILPGVERPGYTFRGWYYDADGLTPAGGPGDRFIPRENVTLYAGWKEDLKLTAEVERILEPHNPVFRCGESGILRFTVWGYADRVEVRFPKELTGKNPEYNVDYPYGGTVLSSQETIQFMIPLHMPMGEYEITVTAYRGEGMVQEFPVFWTLGEGESVLKEIRTRLR